MSEPKVEFCTLRDGDGETHIECRMSDGQKGAFVVVDESFPELAQRIASFLNGGGDVSRESALEEAALICANVSLNSEPDDFALDAANECAEKIRALKSLSNSTRADYCFVHWQWKQCRQCGSESPSDTTLQSPEGK